MTPWRTEDGGWDWDWGPLLVLGSVGCQVDDEADPPDDALAGEPETDVHVLGIYGFAARRVGSIRVEHAATVTSLSPSPCGAFIAVAVGSGALSVTASFCLRISLAPPRRTGHYARVLSVEEAQRRLRELDDPIGVERPEGFDPAATATRSAALVIHLDRVFMCQCERMQALSSYRMRRSRAVVVPAAATKSGADVAIRVSNFGTFAVYGLEHFGAHDDAERDLLLDPVDRDRLETALADTGHVVVPEDVLWTEYDGPNDFWRTHFQGDATPTWFVRYLAQKVLDVWQSEGRRKPISINHLSLHDTADEWNPDQ